jgi:hypothetical protein
MYTKADSAGLLWDDSYTPNKMCDIVMEQPILKN